MNANDLATTSTVLVLINTNAAKLSHRGVELLPLMFVPFNRSSVSSHFPQLGFHTSFFYSCLLVFYNKIEHVHCKPLRGEKKDCQIKFILNSWRLPPSSLLLTLFSLAGRTARSLFQKARLVYVLHTESVSFSPSWISNFRAEMFCHSSDLSWIRFVYGQSVSWV